METLAFYNQDGQGNEYRLGGCRPGALPLG